MERSSVTVIGIGLNTGPLRPLCTLLPTPAGDVPWEPKRHPTCYEQYYHVLNVPSHAFVRARKK